MIVNPSRLLLVGALLLALLAIGCDGSDPLVGVEDLDDLPSGTAALLAGPGEPDTVMWVNDSLAVTLDDGTSALMVRNSGQTEADLFEDGVHVGTITLFETGGEVDAIRYTGASSGEWIQTDTIGNIVDWSAPVAPPGECDDEILNPECDPEPESVGGVGTLAGGDCSVICGAAQAGAWASAGAGLGAVATIKLPPLWPAAPTVVGGFLGSAFGTIGMGVGCVTCLL